MLQAIHEKLKDKDVVIHLTLLSSKDTLTVKVKPTAGKTVMKPFVMSGDNIEDLEQAIPLNIERYLNDTKESINTIEEATKQMEEEAKAKKAKASKSNKKPGTTKSKSKPKKETEKPKEDINLKKLKELLAKSNKSDDELVEVVKLSKDLENKLNETEKKALEASKQLFNFYGLK